MAESKRILVIEDEELTRKIISEFLTNAGYEVEISPYLASAVGKALSGEFDLITLDLNMPGFHGSEIAEIFENKDLKVPVLIISEALNESMKKQLRTKGIRHFLSKPFKSSDLVKSVEAALGSE